MKKKLFAVSSALLLAGCGITGTPEEMARLSRSLESLGTSMNRQPMPTYQAPAVQPYSTGRTNTYCYVNSFSVVVCR